MSTESVAASAEVHGEFPDPFAEHAPAVADTLALAVPDPDHSLGGSVEDEEPEHPSVLGHLIRQLRPGQDLTRVLIPAFFLEPRSLLEKMADVMMHPQLITEYVWCPLCLRARSRNGYGRSKHKQQLVTLCVRCVVRQGVVPA
jgi:Oxysterol-binding protein